VDPGPTRLTALIAACLITACREPERPVPPIARPKATAKPLPRQQAAVSKIDLTKLFALQQVGQVLIYDARPGFVHAFGHLPGALNWPRGLFDSQRLQHETELKDAIAADRTIVIYCTDAACPDAAAVAERIAKLGYPVSVLDGGFAAWKEAGLPIE